MKATLSSLVLVAALLIPARVGAREDTQKKVIVELGGAVAVPSGGDYDDADYETTFGLRVAGGYFLTRNISVHVGFRYIFATVEDQADDFDLAYWDLGASGRFTAPLGKLSLFAEAMLLWVHNPGSWGNTDGDATGIGFGARAGAGFALSPALDLVGSVSYTSASADDDVGSPISVHIDDDGAWLSLELGVAAHF
jgi:hypothetical protein